MGAVIGIFVVGGKSDGILIYLVLYYCRLLQCYCHSVIIQVGAIAKKNERS